MSTEEKNSNQREHVRESLLRRSVKFLARRAINESLYRILQWVVNNMADASTQVAVWAASQDWLPHAFSLLAESDSVGRWVFSLLAWLVGWLWTRSRK